MGAKCDRRRMRRLVAALRSGRYEQANGVLRDSAVDVGGKLIVRGYCCAGVACDLARRGRIGTWVTNEDGTSAFQDSPDRGGREDREYLTPGVVAWLGLGAPYYSDANEIPLDDDDDSAVAMNDHERTFGEIADALEAYYLS
jgi:hypothetical protein